MGAAGIKYAIWRNEIARPYIRKVQGTLCAECRKNPWTDVAHIKERSTHPERIMKLDNVRGLCRDCHRKEHA